MYVSDKDACRILQISHDLATIREPEVLEQATMRLLLPFIGADIVSLSRLDVAAGHAELRYHPHPPWFDHALQTLTRLMDEHPLVARYTASAAQPGPRRITDLVPRAEWFRSRTYNELFAPMQTRYQLGLPVLARRGNAVGYAFSRSKKDFDVRDVDVATALQPTLVALRVRITGIASTDDQLQRAARYGLSAREAEVLQWLGAGLTATSIARLCRITPATVRKHLASIYRKLGQHDRLMTITYARSLGLLQPPKH
jgi:DNA-binding CsgD family transcriptional regulator